MKIALALVWASAVAGEVIDQRGESSSIPPDTINLSNGNRILQSLDLQHGKRRSGAVQLRTSNLRQQMHPADPYSQETLNEREGELAYHEEVSHMHPYMEKGRVGHYTYAGMSSSAKEDASLSDEDGYFLRIDDNYFSMTSAGKEGKSAKGSKDAKGSKGSKARGSMDKKPKKEKCKSCWIARALTISVVYANLVEHSR
jgi:hypothetical protein